MTYEERAVGQTIGRLLSEHPGVNPSADGALDNLDQFHLGGPGATDLLIESLALTAGDRVLDIGSGFGGPARQIARRTGSHVTGIDITPAYVDAAADLTAMAGLRDLIQFQVADIAAFEPDPLFQAAVTMHVQMNVRDKAAWLQGPAWPPGRYVSRGRPTCPGPCRGRSTAPTASSSAPSRCAPPSSRAVSPRPNGRTRRPGSRRGSARLSRTDGPPAGPALPMLLDDGYTRGINAATALADGSLEIWRGTFTRNPG